MHKSRDNRKHQRKQDRMRGAPMTKGIVITHAQLKHGDISIWQHRRYGTIRSRPLMQRRPAAAPSIRGTAACVMMEGTVFDPLRLRSRPYITCPVYHNALGLSKKFWLLEPRLLLDGLLCQCDLLRGKSA